MEVSPDGADEYVAVRDAPQQGRQTNHPKPDEEDGYGKSTVAVTHTKLRDRAASDKAKAYWSERLGRARGAGRQKPRVTGAEGSRVRAALPRCTGRGAGCAPQEPRDQLPRSTFALPCAASIGRAAIRTPTLGGYAPLFENGLNCVCQLTEGVLRFIRQLVA